MNSNVAITEKVPSGSFAIMVHRPYVERVRDAMLLTVNNNNNNNSWQRISQVSTDIDIDDNDEDSVIRGNADQVLLKNDVSHNVNGRKVTTSTATCQVIDLQQQQQHKLKGGRKDRRGYHLLLVQDSTRSNLMELSPLARQNISWAVPIHFRIQHHQPHSGTSTDDESCDLCSSPSSCCKIKNQHEPCCCGSSSGIGVALLQILVQQCHFDLTKHVLRIDSFPTEQGAEFAKSLQRAAATNDTTTTADTCLHDHQDESAASIDPYDGPIAMTRSISKCTHILTVLNLPTLLPQQHSNEDDVVPSLNETKNTSNLSGYHVSVVLQADHTNLLLNHHASQQVLVESIDGHTGLDVHPDVPPHAPVSRAYYKLLQVWQDYLQPLQQLQQQQPQTFTGIGLADGKASGTNKNDGNTLSIGLDLGAAPGGWTQVLLDHVGLSHVVAVDTALYNMAQRVLQYSSHSNGSSEDSDDGGASRVTYVQADLASQQAAVAILRAMQQLSRRVHASSSSVALLQQHQQPNQNQEPQLPLLQQQLLSISHVVCDSSTDSHRILADVIQLMEQLTLLQQQQQQQSQQSDQSQQQTQQQQQLHSIWTRPLYVVITLKLPYKTTQSVQRNLDKVLDTISDSLRRLALICFGETTNTTTTVEIDYQVVHLMANSDSERTLLVVFR